jgi:hypothetical protein
VISVRRILSGVVDDDRFTALPNSVADGCSHLQFAAGRQAEFDFVANRTCDPSVFGHASDRAEPKARAAADNLQHCRHGVNPGDGRKIVRERLRRFFSAR